MQKSKKKHICTPHSNIFGMYAFSIIIYQMSLSSRLTVDFLSVVVWCGFFLHLFHENLSE